MSKDILSVGAGTIAVIALGIAAGAAGAEPCDTRDRSVDYLPPPYTIEQLKETMTAGLKVVSRMKVTVAGSSLRELTVMKHDENSVELLDAGLESDPIAQQTIANDQRTMTWAELRDTACFPKDVAMRERATVETPFGELGGWRYRVQEGVIVATVFFADDYPGFPALVERWDGNTLMMRVAQVRRSDAASPAEAETTEQPSTTSGA